MFENLNYRYKLHKEWDNATDKVVHRFDTVGIGTTSVDDADLQGIGNSARGLYISNGMILYDNAINGNHYIGTSMNGLMAGPVSVNGVLNVDGNFVVV